MLVRRWQERRSLGRTEPRTGDHAFLYSSGLGTARTVRIYMTYGVDAVQGHDGEPCRLASDIRAIGGGRTRQYNAGRRWGQGPRPGWTDGMQRAKGQGSLPPG
jgi:hypothetical protein